MMKSFVRLTKVIPGLQIRSISSFSIFVCFFGRTGATNCVLRTGGSNACARYRECQAAGCGESRFHSRAATAAGSFNVPGAISPTTRDIRVCTPDISNHGNSALERANFSPRDQGTSLPVAIITQATAARVVSGSGPIGKFVYNFGPNNLKLQIIGPWLASAGTSHLRRRPRPEIYTPLAQKLVALDVRRGAERGGESALHSIPSAQSAVWSIDRNVPLANPRTMQDVPRAFGSAAKIRHAALSIFAGLADGLGGDRSLRRDFLLRRATDQGNRDPDGARRPSAQICCDWFCGKVDCWF
jgi:hypothetical protein